MSFLASLYDASVYLLILQVALCGVPRLALAQDRPPEEANTPPLIPVGEAPADAEVSPAELEALSAGIGGDLDKATRDSSVSTASGAVGPSTSSSNMNPDISVILDVAAATYSHDPLTTGEHDPGEPGFNLQQLELHLGASVDPFFRLDGNIVYTGHGVELEEAFATTLGLPLDLQVRAGQFLSRFGRINRMHPHEWQFADQPLIIGKFFGSDGNRGMGVEASWLTSLPWYAEAIISAQSLAGDCCSRSYEASETTPENPEETQSSPSIMWTGAFKQFFALTPSTSLMWGLSAQTAPQAADGRAVIVGTDIYLRWRPVTSDRRQSLSLQAEGLWRRREGKPEALADYGGYAQLVWGINALWEAGVRAEAVTGLKQDPLDTMWTQTRTRFAAQATYYPTHFSRLRAQALIGRPGWLSHNIVGALVTLEVLVGAHGAHTY